MMKPERLLQLYPGAWRKHYGEEFMALLGERRLTVRQTVNVIGGALDAWLLAWRHAFEETDSVMRSGTGGEMVLRSLKRISERPGEVSAREGIFGAALMLGVCALLTAVGVVFDKAGYVGVGQFVIWMAFFVSLQVAVAFLYLQGQPTRVKVVLTGVPLAIVAGIFAVSIWM